MISSLFGLGRKFHIWRCIVVLPLYHGSKLNPGVLGIVPWNCTTAEYIASNRMTFQWTSEVHGCLCFSCQCWFAGYDWDPRAWEVWFQRPSIFRSIKSSIAAYLTCWEWKLCSIYSCIFISFPGRVCLFDLSVVFGFIYTIPTIRIRSVAELGKQGRGERCSHSEGSELKKRTTQLSEL